MDHDQGPGHAESPARLEAVLEVLKSREFSDYPCLEAPAATRQEIARVHTAAHIDEILAARGTKERIVLDSDTSMSAGSTQAALFAAGAGIAAVDAVLSGQARRAFCALRPPGHHAEPHRAMGFCLFNNIAIAAAHALTRGVKRVAIVDFDVHHGNGTQVWAETEPRALFISSHQMPLYPGTGAADERGPLDNILNIPFAAGTAGAEFRAAYEWQVFPRLKAFAPDFIFISAGFDAHRDDPLGGMKLVEEDFAWVTRELAALAEELCDGRIVSCLEGGYNIPALAASVAAHMRALDDTAESAHNSSAVSA
ncbi:MAG: histone deacetylase family protein [Alphaproteobacteria bacterium]